jgi:hypothetical protein
MNLILDDIFTVSDTSHKNYDKAVDIVNFPTVHRDDSEPLTVILLDIKRGPWVAGGACLRWFQGQPVGESDIDVFCANAKQAADVIERVKSYGRYSVKFESENAVTLSYYDKNNNSFTIQIITRRFFSSMQEVIDNFDISVCQVGTCGTEWILGNDTAKDIREKNLRMCYPPQPDAPKRLTKYWIYGYRPVPGLLTAIMNNPDTRWSYSLDEDYSNAF